MENWAKDAQDNRDDAWFSLSVVHLIGVIANIEPDFLSRLESNGLKTSVLRDNVIARLENEVNDQTNAYISYWLYEALAVTDSTAGENLIQGVDWIASIDKELAAATASISEVNPLELASATSLALLAGQCRKDGSRESRHFNAAVEFLSGHGDSPTKRNVVDHGRYRFLHNLPFEELLILGKVAPNRFPTVLPRFAKLFDFLRPRLRIIGHDAVGVTDESSPRYPEVVRYATGYMGVLTDSVLRPLRFSLKRRLSERLQERGLPGEAGPVRGASETFLDTEEKVFERLSEAVTGCIVSGAMNFERLSLVNTILLFGPPGTGKTTVVERLTSHLNDLDCAEPDDPWYLLSLTPSVFLVSDSFNELLDNVEEIFAAILETERAVFFFDEAEELMRRREKDDLRIGRLFTSAMLIHLNRLKKAHSISVFATNFIDMIDDAASRKGRFAIRKGVGPVAPDEIKAYVDKELDANSPHEREIVRKCLRDRVGIEVVQLIEFAKNCSVVDEEMFNSHRPFIGMEDLTRHREKVKVYDDK